MKWGKVQLSLHLIAPLRMCFKMPGSCLVTLLHLIWPLLEHHLPAQWAEKQIQREQHICFPAGQMLVKTTYWSPFHSSHLSRVSCAVQMSFFQFLNFPSFSRRRANIRCYFGLLTAVEEMIASVKGESHVLLNVCKCARERLAKSAGEVTGQEWGEGGMFNS